jgi:hypothetical protein
MIKRESNTSVRLCCGKKNCPVVENLNDGTFKITDDYGNSIIIKKEEALILSDGVNTLTGENLILG